MRATDPADPIAICVSDLHLSHKPPVARSTEPDWYLAMERQLGQLRDLASRYGVPVLCAGDVFDHWDAPAELIHFAHKHLPKMFAVPGQHDLPHHNYALKYKSAYQILEDLGTIENIEPGGRRVFDGFTVTGYPWGSPIAQPAEGEQPIHIALVHAYCWAKGFSYPDAPQVARLSNYRKQLLQFGYTHGVFGDNHRGFTSLSSKGDPTIVNCGTFFRRRSDEVGYRSFATLLRSDGSLAQIEYDTDGDKFHIPGRSDFVTDLAQTIDMRDFMDELGKLGGTALDFFDALKQFLRKPENGVSKGATKLIHELLDKRATR